MRRSTKRDRGRLGASLSGAWHVAEALWGSGQRVRLITGPPSLVTEPERVRSVHAALFLDAGARVLLVQNKDESWTFPGGRLEGMESPDEALVREVWEEARAIPAPGYVPVAATRIEYLNRVPGRVYRCHPAFLLWVCGQVATLSDEPHHDPADFVARRCVTTLIEARALLAPLEQCILDAASARAETAPAADRRSPLRGQ